MRTLSPLLVLVALSAAIAGSTSTVSSRAALPVSRAMTASSSCMDATLGPNVVSMPRREPRSSAARNIASLGLRTGTFVVRANASIAGPKAEHVKSTASAPVESA